MHLAATHELRRSIDVRGGAHIGRPPILRLNKLLEEQAIVFVIERLTEQIRSATPSLAVNSRTPAEGADYEPGIVGDGRDAGAVKEIPRLREGILLERRKRFEVFFVRRLDKPSLAQVYDRNAVHGKQRTQLAELAFASGR
jgi:hypothetical protein